MHTLLLDVAGQVKVQSHPMSQGRCSASEPRPLGAWLRFPTEQGAAVRPAARGRVIYHSLRRQRLIFLLRLEKTGKIGMNLHSSILYCIFLFLQKEADHTQLQ